MPDILIELISEEIPARMQARAVDDFKRLMTNGLVEAGITYASAAAFVTPRRLCLTVEGALEASPAQTEERKGPRADAPEKAIEGFLRSTGLTREQLQERETPKGTLLFARTHKPGRPVAEILAEVLDHTIRTFPWPKSMRWGAGSLKSGSLKWVRPLHSILCILVRDDGAETVPFAIDGLTAGNTTRGHRFHAPDAFKVHGFDDYAAKLRAAHVVLDPAVRADTIWHDATNIAFANGLELIEDAGLLAEVAGLVEWPVVLMGRIGADFLELPPEVLQTSMKAHQKFFSVRNPKTGRIERFITVANRETADGGATILAGNEKVLSARLSDARFFWENDLRVATGLEGMNTWVQALENVTFHNKLGTQGEQIERMAVLAREIAPMVGADPDEAEQAARIAKADLSSEMVYEFPELQGLMGGYYAKAAGMSDTVANAAKEHYAPLGPSDDVPTTPVSVAVALAEKIDKLTGFWAIDEKPTGSKDPFALRRAALGIVRTLLENEIGLSMRLFVKCAQLNYLSRNSFFMSTYRYDQRDGDNYHFERSEPNRRAMLREGNDEALATSLFVYMHDKNYDEIDYGFRLTAEDISDYFGEYESKKVKDFVDRLILQEHLCGDQTFGEIASLRQEVATGKYDEFFIDTNSILSFLHDRLKTYLRDQNIRHDVIDACIAMENNDDLALLTKRARALSETLKTDDGENLLQAFKRANNILTQAEAADGVEYSFGPDPKFAETGEEKALFKALDEAEAKIAPAMEQQDFATAMSAMAALRAPLDGFFEAVQINTDNGTLRRNRLNLLSRIRAICTSVADLTRIDG